jgi:hypothetical protein
MGGLGGNNAHGAGFLEAALETKTVPGMISCTSGQLLWVDRYLCCLKDHEAAGLRAQLAQDIEGVRVYQNDDLDFARMALMGKPGVCQPAGKAYVADAWQNAGKSVGHLLRDKHPFVTRRMLEIVPCRLLVPDFPDNFFEDISNAFNEEQQIGIVFNSYNPQDGCEHIYLNDRARHLLHRTSRDRKHYQPGRESSYREYSIYQTINPAAVRDALWVYQYGFDRPYGAFLDGAYFREIILSELTHAHHIYAVRPMDYRWLGELPSSFPQMADLQTKVNFNGCYAGERHQIDLVNKLLRDGKLNKKKYHRIDVEPFEMKRTRSFFGYVFEEVAVFDEAYEQALKLLKGGNGGPLRPRPASLAAMARPA